MSALARNGSAPRRSGSAAIWGKVEALPAGSFFSLPPGMNHFVYVDEETVIQINTWVRGTLHMSAQRTIHGRESGSFCPSAELVGMHAHDQVQTHRGRVW